jgi:hypothetical protein
MLAVLQWSDGALKMSEFKPKKDDSRANSDGRFDVTKTGDSPKAHGDKLQHAVDEAAHPVQKKR